MNKDSNSNGESQSGLSRRHFFESLVQGVTVGAVVASAGYSHAEGTCKDGATAEGPPDFSRESNARSGTETVRSACTWCNSGCGFEVDRIGERIVGVRGVASDPVQAGQLCVKAELSTEVLVQAQRLKRPLRRVAGAKGDPDSRFEEISWEEAFDRIADQLLRLREAGEAHTVASKTSGRLLRGTGDIIARFFALYGSPNATDVGPVCNDAGGNALAMTFGLPAFTNGYGKDEATGEEDLGQAQLALLFGTNQAETHPVTFAHLLREKAKRRARYVCIDPRRTPTAAHCDEWLAIRPHADLALALGMIATIVSERLYDQDFVSEWVLGFEALRAHLLTCGYSAEWAATKTGLTATRIVELAREYATTKPAAIWCNAGISHQVSAFATYRAFAILAAITGNIGRAGGGCNFMHNTWPGALGLPPITADLPTVREALPVGPDAFPRAILDRDPYPLRMVFAVGNPLLASAQSQRVRDSYQNLEFFVWSGLFPEEAMHHADIVLPVKSGLEIEGVYMRRDDRGIRWQDAAAKTVGECRTDIEIWLGLAQTMARKDRLRGAAYWTEALPPAWSDYRVLWDTFVAHTESAGGMTTERLRARNTPLRWPCPSVDHPGTSTLYRDDKSWRESMAALGHPGKRFATPSGRIEFTTKALEARFAGSGHHSLPTWYTHEACAEGPETIAYGDWISNPLHPKARTRSSRLGVVAAQTPDYPLLGTIGRSSVVHFAGATHWTPTGKRLDGLRWIQLHERVAQALQIRLGDEVIVESAHGRLRGLARPTLGIREDVIFIPNGFGPAQSMGDFVSAPRYAEPANILVSDELFDPLSGQVAYKCFACRLSPA